MKVFKEKPTQGTNLENLYRQGYSMGRKEQLEHDVSMLEGLVEKSRDCEDFMDNLSFELMRIKGELELRF